MTASTAHVRHLILGTAGHIDHGKTALVKRLTGTWTDTLPEEKERGMTIDVGYAAFTMPDGAEVGLLDVPGHERLVRTMVAAATAMDLALLVVAADDGPMPQTREHVEILDVLGVRRLVVALTKTDLVDEETRLLAAEEIEEMLAPTGMAGAPIVPVSSETGDGFDDLQAAIAEALPPPRETLEDDPFIFRMPVLRRFHVQGRGAVLTGIPVAGSVSVGDRVTVLPRDWTGKVRGIQVHHRDAQTARRGHRAAMALSDVAVDKVKRGMTIATHGVIRPVHRIACRLQILPSARKAMAHGDRARAHLGADQAVVRIHLPMRTPIEPGGFALVELESSAPLVACPGDRFVLRAENASSTLGGGVVIEPRESRIPTRRQGMVDRLLARVEHLSDPAALVQGMLEAAGDRGIVEADICAHTAIRPDVLPRILERMASEGEVLPIGRTGRWIRREGFDRVQRMLDEAVRKMHEKDRAVDNLSLAAVRAAVHRVEPVVLEEAIDHLIAKGRLLRMPNGNVKHKDHSGEMPEKDRVICEKVLTLLATGGGRPPTLEELEAEGGLGGGEVNRALRLLDTRGEVFKAEGFWFASSWVEEAKGRLAAHARAEGGFTPADARTLLDTTRKWIIPFLEALDKSGFCRRDGARRVLRD